MTPDPNSPQPAPRPVGGPAAGPEAAPGRESTAPSSPSEAGPAHQKGSSTGDSGQPSRPGVPEVDPRPTDFPTTPGTLDRSLEVVRFLRAHCPWDRRQTPRSLVRYLLEEAAETAFAVRSGNAAAMEDELGDLLLNVAFQIVIAEEEGTFSAESVVRGLERKMKRRHPDLFAGGSPRTWNEIKAEEAAASHGPTHQDGGETPGATPEQRASLMDTLPPGLEPLLRAYRLQKHAAQVGFDWPDIEGPLAKLSEEAHELQGALEAGEPSAIREEVGDLLFTVVNIARRLGIHPEAALDEASDKFEVRFRGMERLAVARAVRLEDATLDELEDLWQESKGWARRSSDSDDSSHSPERDDSTVTASGSDSEDRNDVEP